MQVSSALRGIFRVLDLVTGQLLHFTFSRSNLNIPNRILFDDFLFNGTVNKNFQGFKRFIDGVGIVTHRLQVLLIPAPKERCEFPEGDFVLKFL